MGERERERERGRGDLSLKAQPRTNHQPCYTAPLAYFPCPLPYLASSLPSLTRETSQKKEAEDDWIRSGTRSVRLKSEEAGEKKTRKKVAPGGAKSLTEEEVASSQSHAGIDNSF